jgi:predicted DNA-binding transcriptional regulator AlpA
MMTFNQVCQDLSLSPTQLRRMIAKGTFVAPIRLSESRIGFLAASVDSWLAERT